jgi:hypothetical protein
MQGFSRCAEGTPAGSLHAPAPGKGSRSCGRTSMRRRRSSAARGERAKSSTPDTALSAHQQPSAAWLPQHAGHKGGQGCRARLQPTTVVRWPDTGGQCSMHWPTQASQRLQSVASMRCAPRRCTGSSGPRSGRSAWSTAATVFFLCCPATCTGSVGGLPIATTSADAPNTCDAMACHLSPCHKRLWLQLRNAALHPATHGSFLQPDIDPLWDCSWQVAQPRVVCGAAASKCVVQGWHAAGGARGWAGPAREAHGGG